jgi:fatty acid/phospholipid biosynthesis enzyme
MIKKFLLNQRISAQVMKDHMVVEIDLLTDASADRMVSTGKVAAVMNFNRLVEAVHLLINFYPGEKCIG